MLGTRQVEPVSTDDRALRDELEALQVALRELRAARGSTSSRLASEEASLRQALEAATARQEAAAAELERLGHERRELEARLARWKEQLEVRRRESQVLAVGATRRDHYVEWMANPPRSAGERSPLPAWYFPLMAILAALFYELGQAFGFWR